MRKDIRDLEVGRRRFLSRLGKGLATIAGLASGIVPREPVAAQQRTTSTAALRTRTLIDADWRFTKGDPPSSPSLLYDVRPQAGARGAPTPAPTPEVPIVKDWIRPSGNDFIKDPGKRARRPEGNLGGAVAYVGAEFNDSSWQNVDVPHDYAIEGPFSTAGGGGMGRLPSAGVGWYRKRLNIPANSAGKSIFLDIDGAMSYSEVWLNGRFVGGWPYGYASFRLNLTPYARPGGTNVLAIRLDNPPASSRWYPGGGLYRNVWLVETAPVHVGQWGTYITTPSCQLGKIEGL